MQASCSYAQAPKGKTKDMKPKVLLVRPNITARKGFELQNRLYPPIGLAYLAGSLIESGAEVRIVDMVAEAPEKVWDYRGTHSCYGITDDELMEIIRQGDPDVIGVSGFTSQHQRIVEITSAIRRDFPSKTIVLGGIHATAMTELLLKSTAADFIIRGQGETTFPALVKALVAGNQEAARILEGIAYRDGDNCISKEASKIQADINLLAAPAFHLLANEVYLQHHVSMPIITSRGCPYDCLFCSVALTQGRGWRDRSPENVVDEIETIVKKWHYKTISVFDDAFNVRPDRVVAICQEIVRRDLSINLLVPSSLMIKHITRDTLYWLKKAGCVAVSLPFEHSDETIRNTIISKGLTNAQFQTVLEWCRELGLLTIVNFVIGLPGENEQTLQSLNSYVRENAFRMDALAVYIGTPFPGTRFYEECITKGYLKNPDKNDFIDFDLYECLIDTPQLASETVNKYKQIIEATFSEVREGHFNSQYIRQAIRKPDEASLDYINTVYMKQRAMFW